MASLSNPPFPPSLHIWRFMDGKPGHQNQTLGLIESLKDRIPCVVKEWQVPSTFLARLYWKRQWRKEIQGCSNPDILMGAGHATHRILRRACQQFGGRSVVLMKPSLPHRSFDLCVVPEHDQHPGGDGIMIIKGVLNAIPVSASSNPCKGLILIGGPCRHVHWNNHSILVQVQAVLQRTPEVHWTLTTSRRTPDTFLDQLQESMKFRNLTLVPASATYPGWVAEHLAEAGQAWATADSVSMLYESLSSGTATGVLEVRWAKEGKLKRGVQQLLNEAMVASFQQWQKSGRLFAPKEPLAEAVRVADWIMKHWFSPSPGERGDREGERNHARP